MAENPKIDPEFSDPDLIGELTAEEPATAEGFTPLEAEPVEKIVVYKVIDGEEIKMDEEEVTILGADGVAEAVYRVTQGLMTKDGLAKHLLNQRDVKGKDRARLQARLKEGKCQKCLKTIGACIRRDEINDADYPDGRFFGLSGAFIKQVLSGGSEYDDAKAAISRVCDKRDDEEFDQMNESETDETVFHPTMGHVLLGIQRLMSIAIEDVPKDRLAEHNELLQAVYTFSDMLSLSREDTPDEAATRLKETGQVRNYEEEGDRLM